MHMQQICDRDSLIYLYVYTIHAPTVLVNPGQVSDGPNKENPGFYRNDARHITRLLSCAVVFL